MGLCGECDQVNGASTGRWLTIELECKRFQVRVLPDTLLLLFPLVLPYHFVGRVRG